ncbi:MAG: hypothetical protein ACI956_000363 [Nonlabens sp.]|jgi:hypothetical protein
MVFSLMWRKSKVLMGNKKGFAVRIVLLRPICRI